MTTILAAAASGMVQHSTTVDLVGNNLANANTTAFKRSRVLSQGAPVSNATPETSRLGVSQTTADVIFDTGVSLRTDDPMHFAISDGAFLAVTDFDGQTVFTRAGNLAIDSAGNVTAAKARPLSPPVTIPEGYRLPQVTEAGAVTAESPEGVREDVGQLSFSRFMNPQGLTAIGEGLFRESANSGNRTDGTPGTEGFALIAPGVVEGSNVELAEEFTTLLIAQRAYQASAKTFSVGDEMLALATNLTR
jgi:flagellar basal-body rod protein FlgG